MKTRLKNQFPLPLLIAALGFIPAVPLTAQTFTILHSFSAISTSASGIHTNSDGSWPQGGVTVTNGTLYGTGWYGGPSANGTIFRAETDGTGFRVLHSFTAMSGPSYTNSDGAWPSGGLVLSADVLYGTTSLGGPSGSGTVFAIKTNGSGFTNVLNFRANALILSGDTLYGATDIVDASGQTTVFKMKTDGSAFTTLHSFSPLSPQQRVNSDGAGPNSLVLSGNTLYGTADAGGTSGDGAIFAVNTDGTGFTNLHSFSWYEVGDSFYPLDGADPSGLVLSGGTLYGTAPAGGNRNELGGSGTVFAVNTDGSDFRVLHKFEETSGSYPGPYINRDGAWPQEGLISAGSTLYGTTRIGGSSGHGTLFALKTDGTGFTNLYVFTAGSFAASTFIGPNVTNHDGAYPNGLFLSGDKFYATAFGGGSGSGTVFSLSFTPNLRISSLGPNLVLSWPTNYAGFDYTGYILQSTTNLLAPAVWTTVSPGPVVTDGQNAVTNLISSTEQFYRLSR